MARKGQPITIGSEQKRQFSTISGLDIKPVYAPEDIKDLDFDADIGSPGSYPFTRSCQRTGYRGKIWTLFGHQLFLSSMIAV